ncbi:MAG TPA: FISUMP domain-containing protein [Bacteroidia bacterium]
MVAISFTDIAAQVKFGNNPGTINSNSVLELESTNKGLLMPRVALSALNLASPLSAHVAGMTVYNTATAGTAPNNVTPGYYYNDGTQWVRIPSVTPQDYDWRKANNQNPDAVGDTAVNVYHMGTAGIGVNKNETSAKLQIDATNQGVLFPRLSNFAMKAIATPVNGLMVYNTSLRCLAIYQDSSFHCSYSIPSLPPNRTAPMGSSYSSFYNGWSGGTYSVGGAGTTTITHTAGEAFSSNTECVNKQISAQGCGGLTRIQGESGRYYNLTNINGQCWMKEALREVPSNFAFYHSKSYMATTVASDTGLWGFVHRTDLTGASGFADTASYAGEGYVYQWSAAMNNSLRERSRGVCPAGFHIPSSCEFRYLEHGLGMSLACQAIINATRCNAAGQGNVATKLRGATSVTGFNELNLGYRQWLASASSFINTPTTAYMWTSSIVAGTYNRGIFGIGNPNGFPIENGTRRFDTVSTGGMYGMYEVRCLKD